MWKHTKDQHGEDAWCWIPRIRQESTEVVVISYSAGKYSEYGTRKKEARRISTVEDLDFFCEFRVLERFRVRPHQREAAAPCSVIAFQRRGIQYVFHELKLFLMFGAAVSQARSWL